MAGRFYANRAVFDAAWIDTQSDLLRALRDSGVEIVLDSNVAELCARGRFDGAPRRLPWAKEGRPLAAEDLSRGAIDRIAEFAVAREVDVVLAPTHFLLDAGDEALRVDLRLCPELRAALDRAGGRRIAIDYPLLTTYSALRDSVQRRAFMARLQGLPFDNLWLRISGFGADASAVKVRRYIAALLDLISAGKPIVADRVGGLAGLAVVSFGASGAIAHGVGERERFDASDWNRPRRVGGGGQNGRLYLPAIDRLLPMKDAQVLMDAKGARRILSCHDSECCPRGADDMMRDPKAHFLKQRAKQLQEISSIPEQRRADRFLLEHLAAADRSARQAAKIQPGDEHLSRALKSASIRLDKLRMVLDDLYRTLGDEGPRSAAPAHRAKMGGAALSGLG